MWTQAWKLLEGRAAPGARGTGWTEPCWGHRAASLRYQGGRGICSNKNFFPCLFLGLYFICCKCTQAPALSFCIRSYGSLPSLQQQQKQTFSAWPGSAKQIVCLCHDHTHFFICVQTAGFRKSVILLCKVLCAFGMEMHLSFTAINRCCDFWVCRVDASQEAELTASYKELLL